MNEYTQVLRKLEPYDKKNLVTGDRNNPDRYHLVGTNFYFSRRYVFKDKEFTQPQKKWCVYKLVDYKFTLVSTLEQFLERPECPTVLLYGLDVFR